MTSEPMTLPEETYFATVAADYDRLQPILAGPGYEAGLSMLVDLVPFDEDDAFTFVDLGCGTGALAQRVLERFANARAICIDGEPAMLRVARTKLAGYGDRVDIRHADLLPCDVPTCDLVVSSLVFHHVPPQRLEDAFDRIAGALPPGGCLLLMDQMAAGPTWGLRVGSQRRRLHDRHAAGWISVGRATPEEIDARWALKRSMKEQGLDAEYRHTAENLLAEMAGAGITETALVWRMFAMTILMGFA